MNTEVNKMRLSLLFSKLTKDYAVIFAALLLGIVFSFTSPYFLTLDNLTNIFLQAATVSIVAIGQSTALLTGQFDLSIGQNVCLSGYVIALLMNIVGINPWLSIIIGILVAVMVGAINGTLVAYLKIPSFIATLGMQFVCRGSAKLINDAKPIPRLPEEISFIGRGYVLNIIPISVLIMIILYIVMQFISRKTKTGRNLYTVGGNPEAAFFAGINIKKIYLTAFAISGLFAGLASTVLISRLNGANITNGNLYEFDAMISCVIGGISLSGGKGNIIGALFGALFLIMFFNGMTLLNVDPFFQDILKGVVLIAAISVDVFRNNQRKA